MRGSTLNQKDNPDYIMTMMDLDAPDPLSGETPIDKELAVTSEKYDQDLAALKAVAVSDWGKIPAIESVPASKRKVR